MSTAKEAERFGPVIDILRFDRFPPAARKRELKRAADAFASSPKPIFKHYVDPVLKQFRAVRLSSGKARKKYYKTAVQLWQDLENAQYNEYFFWHEVAKELRIAISTGDISHEDVLRYGGWSGRVKSCQ